MPVPPIPPEVLLEETLEALRRTPGFQPGERVIAAMSGGIDSSVMAVLLQRAGFEVIGLSMQLFDKRETGATTDRCCSLDDFQDARRVAHQAGFPHYVMDFEERFRREVMDPFAASYLAGETPSPCILCNKHLKFDALFETADELGARWVATGHYARIAWDGRHFRLLKASDPAKDQSYFLFAHTQATLARTLFPLESLQKSQVRQLAAHLGLHLAEKAESQEICFIPQGRYDEYLETRGLDPGRGEGPILHVDGRRLGTHRGFWRFTIGQRKGLKIAYPEPLYVIRLDPGSNTVWVGEEDCLLGGRLVAREATWCVEAPSGTFPCEAKLRSRSAQVPAAVTCLEDGRLEVRFNEPQRAITPGQALVLYRGEEVLGGGWIERLL